MSELTEYEITEAMIVYGGSFVAGLGRLYRQADHDNQRALVNAFPAYFKEYEDIARGALLRKGATHAGGGGQR